MRVRTPSVIISAILATALALGACTGKAEEASERVAAPEVATTTTTVAGPVPQNEPAVRADREIPAAEPGVLVAQATGTVDVHDVPGGAVTAALPATTEFGSPTTMLVVGDQEDWLEVALPVRPNGSRGWVPREQVELARVRHHVHVDLAARTLTVTVDDEVLLTTPVAVGSAENPTPGGAHFVTDVIDTQNDGGAYGPFALGLSAHSDTLSEFAGGDGQIGIHGTNDPSSIGNAVSHGCVRVPNEVIVQLAQQLPLGTPVTIG